jgi:signal transduction histidine kinase
MFSETRDSRRASAAWRIAGWPTVAFAVGSAVAFALMYLLIARDIRQRSDEWLSGEAETLADVSANTPRDSLYERLVQEVAELASHEVAPSTDTRQQNTVFFLQITPRLEPIWVGPQPKERFIQQIQNAHLVPGVPASLKVEGWKKPFRVVYHAPVNGGGIFLGFSDVAGSKMLERLTVSCLLAWVATVLLGFAVAWTVAHRTLARVVRITETVSEIGTEDLGTRLPEAPVRDEISRLSHTFNRMLDRIQASVNQLHVLTDSVAHDLKSPVTSIRGSLEVALSDDKNGQWRERVAEAIEGLDRLSLMLNTTLDLAEADGGALRLHKEPVDVAELVHQLVELYKPAMDMQSHKLQTSLEAAVVEGDVALLNRAIANLLDNELAHLPSDQEISISLRPEAGHAVLVIEDSGSGFPRDLRERAFQRFVKGAHSTGHGLGLAFVDAVAQAHGGSVNISDRPGGGAMIVFALPLAEVFEAKNH